MSIGVMRIIRSGGCGATGSSAGRGGVVVRSNIRSSQSACRKWRCRRGRAWPLPGSPLRSRGSCPSTTRARARVVDGHEPRLRSGDPGRGHARPRRHRHFRQADCEDLMFDRTTTPPRPADDPVAPQPPERMMRITPMDMRQQRFKPAMRGYDKTEVVAFLTEAADDYEHALREIDRLRADLMRMEALLAEHRHRENNLRDTLLTAQRLS